MEGESLEDFGHVLDIGDISWTLFEIVGGVATAQWKIVVVIIPELYNHSYRWLLRRGRAWFKATLILVPDEGDKATSI